MGAEVQRCRSCGEELVITVQLDETALTEALNQAKEDIMTALDDLRAADADLADTVGTVVAGINRLEADFANLEQAAQSGDSDAIQAEVAKVRDAITALKAAGDSIAATDPQPEPPATPPADSGEGDGANPPSETV